MADAEGERVKAPGGRNGAAATKGRSVFLGPPKFLNLAPRKRGAHVHGPRRRRVDLRAARACGVTFLRAAQWTALRLGGRDHRHAVLAPAPQVRLDFYIEALFQKMRPLALGLRATTMPRVVNLAAGASGARLAYLAASYLPYSVRGEWMAKNPVIRSLSNVSLEEALAYLDNANGDELTASFDLARDRNRLDGSTSAPDDAEIHHALFLLRKARGLDAPSFDLMRVQLRRRQAA